LLSGQGEHVTVHNKDRKKPRLDPKEAPLCACGCGEKVLVSQRYRGTRYNRYVVGHFGKITSRIVRERP
jgi:hypothetical protein